MRIKTFILKAFNKAYKLSRDGLLRIHDGLAASYGQPTANLDSLQAPPSTAGRAVSQRDLSAVRNILAHSFSLLGSGWDQSSLLNWQESILNKANRDYAQQVSALISPEYHRLDWHLDPKSGHRWDPATWQAAITYGRTGEEVLMPWSLGRMQQLPFLARCWADPALRSEIALDGSGADPLLLEFQNEILDFISANPPHWGVNWASPMDTAIRAINWLVAYDIFVSNGAIFPNTFLPIFEASLWDHAHFLWQFQEWDPILRNNHYLADLTGLIVIAVHFPTNRKMHRWLRISAKRLIREIQTQFNLDGSNFESSTCYHMLSTELVMLALSALFSIPLEGRRALQSVFGSADKSTLFPAEQPQHLTKIHQFLTDVLMGDGRALQIGDNDSGRILKTEAGFWADAEPSLARNFQALRQQMAFFMDHYDQWNQLDGEDDETSPLLQVFQASPTFDSPSPHPAEGWRSYPGMGVYLYRNELYRLAVRCGPIGQNGLGGHTHNDQLSITLHVHDQPVIVDPGSFCYTPDPLTRWKYRSTASHNTLTINGMEQNLISPPEKMVFRMTDRAHAKGEISNENSFEGAHWGYGEKHTRWIQPLPDQINLRDQLTLSGLKQVHFHFHPTVKSIKQLAMNQWRISGEDYTLEIAMGCEGDSTLADYLYSPEYGEQVAAKELVFSTVAEDIAITLSLDEPFAERS